MKPEYDHRAVRRDYEFGELHREDLNPNPVLQLQDWLDAARQAGNFDPTAMCLSTCSPDGQPSARYVLLKHFDSSGLCFYTDTRSRKGAELAENPKAALTFYWPELDRQVRVAGAVEPLTAQDNEAYFQQRPRLSRVSAVASTQSNPIESRAALEQRFADIEQQYAGAPIPRNPAWGGFRVIPAEWEFWQGRRSRLHDRFVYHPQPDNPQQWQMTRLMP